MKKIIFIVMIIFLSLEANVIAPKWFKQKTNTHIIYAYGNTLDIAYQNAINKVKNNLKINNIHKDDFILLKKEIFELKYFLKLQYINENIETQIIKELKKFAFKSKEQTNKQLINTIFFKNINAQIGYYPNIELVDNYLFFNNNKFLIKQHEMEQFISHFQDDNISISIKEKIKENEKFFIELSSNYDGFINLSMYFENTFSLLLQNQKIDDFIIYPNFKLSDGISLSLNDTNTSKVLFNVSVCENKKDFSNYKLLYGEKNHNNLNYSDYINEIKECKISIKTINLVK
jgi:hypothetical protein